MIFTCTPERAHLHNRYCYVLTLGKQILLELLVVQLTSIFERAFLHIFVIMDSKHLDRIPIPDDSFLVVNEEVVETSCDSRVISTTLSSPSLPKPVKQATFFDTSDHSNGALFEESDYCWSQTRNEIGKKFDHHS